MFKSLIFALMILFKGLSLRRLYDPERQHGLDKMNPREAVALS
jgi:hypothetical protein